MATACNFFCPCPRLTFHCSIFLCQSSLSLSFLTSLSFSWSLCLLSFALLLYLLSSLIFFSLFRPLPFASFLFLPFSSSALPNPLHTHTYPSAVMACVQRMQLAKPRASAEIDEHYRHSFTGCVCVSFTGSLCCVCMPVSVSVAIDCWLIQCLSVCL